MKTLRFALVQIYVLHMPYTLVCQLAAVFTLCTLSDSWYSQRSLDPPYSDTATYLQNKRKQSVTHTP